MLSVHRRLAAALAPHDAVSARNGDALLWPDDRSHQQIARDRFDGEPELDGIIFPPHAGAEMQGSFLSLQKGRELLCAFLQSRISGPPLRVEPYRFALATVRLASLRGVTGHVANMCVPHSAPGSLV
jgi:hypothetical protein